MNKKQLLKLGVPADSVGSAVMCVQSAVADKRTEKSKDLLLVLFQALISLLKLEHWAQLSGPQAPTISQPRARATVKMSLSPRPHMFMQIR